MPNGLARRSGAPLPADKRRPGPGIRATQVCGFFLRSPFTILVYNSCSVVRLAFCKTHFQLESLISGDFQFCQSLLRTSIRRTSPSAAAPAGPAPAPGPAQTASPLPPPAGAPIIAPPAAPPPINPASRLPLPPSALPAELVAIV